LLESGSTGYRRSPAVRQKPNPVAIAIKRADQGTTDSGTTTVSTTTTTTGT
jgi:hypothetical protein